MTQVIMPPTLHEDAVRHAEVAERAAALSWRHLQAEFTQDIDKVLGTLDTKAPLAWTLPVAGEDGSYTYLVGEGLPEIRQRYEELRDMVEIWGWEAVAEIRQSWYLLTHGVVTIKLKETGESFRSETVTMFPVGYDGITGEVQIGEVGAARQNRWPEAPQSDGDIPVPNKRLEALGNHDQYIKVLRNEDVDGIVEAHREDGAAAIRNYLTEQASVLTTNNAAELGTYFEEFYSRYRVRDVQLVNRIVESWYVFAELHWSVTEHSSGRDLEFCTAETAPLDPDGRYWVRTGAGTDPVALSDQP